jgi:photosystem II stability/assembly factor-like uncharacterized protein
MITKSLLITIFIIITVVFSYAYEWQQIGLEGKTVLSIAIDPDNSDNLIAGTNAGLFVSASGGSSWVGKISLAHEFPDVAYAPLAIDTVFCLASQGSSDNGLYYSEDDGQNWYLVGNYVNPRRMGFDSLEPGFMYMCFSDGIVKSQNYGQTYSPANNGLPGTDILDVTGDGAHSLEAYAVGTSFLAQTTNFGNSWTEMLGSFDVPNNRPKRLVFEPNGPETLYVSCQQTVATSINGGLTWNYTDMPITAIASIACHPDTPGEIYVGSQTGGGIYKSVDAGETFFAINGNLDNTHIHSLAIGPDNYLYAGTENGIYKVDMATVAIDDTPEIADVYSLDQNYPNPFNNQTVIEFSVSDTEHAIVELFDIKGRLVRTLFDGYGPGRITWDGTDEAGESVSSGIYFYRLQTANKTEYRRMTFLK